MQIYSMETVSWPGNISIKILLAKITFLFWILLCYLLNMSSLCFGNTSCCSLAMLVLSCSAFLWYSDCSVSVPPLFWYSTDVPCSVVPCSCVPGFIVSWDGCNFYFLFWAIVYSFTPAPLLLTAQNIKIKEKRKKNLEISSFYLYVPEIMIRWCMVPKVWCAMERQTDHMVQVSRFFWGPPELPTVLPISWIKRSSPKFLRS